MEAIFIDKRFQIFAVTVVAVFSMVHPLMGMLALGAWWVGAIKYF
jgi:hypothetical protein